MIRYFVWLGIVSIILFCLVLSIATRTAELMLPYLLLGMPAAYHLGKAGKGIQGMLIPQQQPRTRSARQTVVDAAPNATRIR